MRTVSDLIRLGDPLNDEPVWSPEVRQGVRQKVLNVAAEARPSFPAFRKLVAVTVVTLALVFVAAATIVPRVWAPPVQAQASVRFEIRLAEDSPGHDRQPVAGAGGTIYIHRDPVIVNSDIATARVITVSRAAFGVEVTFTPTGSEKILRATGDHVGKRIAILIDGQVVATPHLRSAIRSSAEIDGIFARSEAERIAKGMIGR